MTDILASRSYRNHTINRGGHPRGCNIPLGEPQVLRPFIRDEVVSIGEAALIAGRAKRTVREWCLLYDLGRRIVGQWSVSKVALAMFLDADKAALDLYLRGNRHSEAVTSYYTRLGVPLPRRRIIGSISRS